MLGNSSSAGIGNTAPEREHIGQPEHLRRFIGGSNGKRSCIVQLVANHRRKQPGHCKPFAVAFGNNYLYCDRHNIRLLQYQYRDRDCEPGTDGHRRRNGNHLCRLINAAECRRCHYLQLEPFNRTEQHYQPDTDRDTIHDNNLYRNRHQRRLYSYCYRNRNGDTDPGCDRFRHNNDL